MSGALAQDGATARAKPETPEEKRIRLEGDELYRQGIELLNAGKSDEAIAKIREAIALQSQLMQVFGGYGDLGRALCQAGRLTEAVEAFRRSLCWHKDQLVTSNPYSLYDYAILMARLGKEREAKALYYLQMARAVGPMEHGRVDTAEPIPFLVLFDPEPGMTAWSYSPEALEAAMLMLSDTVGYLPLGERTTGYRTINQLKAERARRLMPEWSFPVVLLARLTHGDKRVALFEQAKLLAKTPEEGSWIEQFQQSLQLPIRERENLSKIGIERRRQSEVLHRAFQELVTDVDFRRSLFIDKPMN